MALANPAPDPRRYGLIEPLRLTEGITRGELADILRKASREAGRLSGRAALGTRVGSKARARQLRAAEQALAALSRSMWGEIGGLVSQGIRDAAELAADHQMFRDRRMGMPNRFIASYYEGLVFSAEQSAQDIISRRTHGFRLADRIYRNGEITVLKVGQIVEESLALQRSAREIARLVRSYYSPDVPGGASYAAMRLGRTEINNAHHNTTIRLSETLPWVEGYRWHLSSSHPKPDECDEFASHDEGLGEGVFGKGNVPSKPHPHCLCYVEVAQMERAEFLEGLIAGRFDRYLSRA